MKVRHGAMLGVGALIAVAFPGAAAQSVAGPAPAADAVDRGVIHESTVVCWGSSSAQLLCKPPNASPVGFADLDVTGPSAMQLAVDELLPGWTVLGRGVGGETSTEIAIRQGAYTLHATFPGNQVPASGSTAVTLSAPPGDYMVMTVSAVIGGIEGHLAHDAKTATWRFTRSAPSADGLPTPVAARTEVVIDQGAHGVRDLPAIYWAGRNNMLHPEVVKRDIAAMVANHDPRVPYLVLGMQPGMGERIGTAGYPVRQKLNAELAEIYGERFVDVEGYLSSYALLDAGITPTAEDRAALAGGTNPPSLTISATDTLHLNATGREVLGRYLARIMQAEWTGAAAHHAPQVSVQASAGEGGDVAVSGWAAHPDRPDEPAIVTVTVDGKTVLPSLPADLPGDDWYGYGIAGRHGFETELALSSGAHQVCVAVTTRGHSTAPECTAVDVPALPQ